MPVQQHVLNWLYSVLTSEYHDVNRTYNDVAQVLSRYSTLSPRTDVHTFSNGSSALLLHLAGTIPVSFRGNTYRFPLSIWVPHAYPREPPLLYVTPTESMMVRPGQHIDPQGQVYHPYLVGWAQYWDKSNIQDFLGVLADIFAKEPPVISRQQTPAPNRAQPVQSPPPVPPLPPDMAARSTGQTHHGSSSPRPPPPPPKPHQESQTASGPSSTQTRSRYDSAPPLPAYAQAPEAIQQQLPPPTSHQGQLASPPARRPFPQTQQTGAAASPASYPPHGPPHGPQQGQWQPHGPSPQHWPPASGIPAPQPPLQQYQQLPPQEQVLQRAAPPPNILDEPLTLDTPSASIVAPPIPPNPEKDALLQQLAQTLYSIRQRSRQQNESSMAGLKAQRSAMMSVIPTIHSEMGQLTQLSNVLTSNASILHDALHKADAVIEGSRSHPAPDVDELLVAPTVVSNQLYNLVAEERALGDAIFMLGRAVERGRVPPAVFAKMTRSLAREWYLKKALARKIATGMGMI